MFSSYSHSHLGHFVKHYIIWCIKKWNIACEQFNLHIWVFFFSPWKSLERCKLALWYLKKNRFIVLVHAKNTYLYWNFIFIFCYAVQFYIYLVFENFDVNPSLCYEAGIDICLDNATMLDKMFVKTYPFCSHGKSWQCTSVHYIVI